MQLSQEIIAIYSKYFIHLISLLYDEFAEIELNFNNLIVLYLQILAI